MTLKIQKFYLLIQKFYWSCLRESLSTIEWAKLVEEKSSRQDHKSQSEASRQSSSSSYYYDSDSLVKSPKAWGRSPKGSKGVRRSKNQRKPWIKREGRWEGGKQLEVAQRSKTSRATLLKREDLTCFDKTPGQKFSFEPELWGVRVPEFVIAQS